MTLLDQRPRPRAARAVASGAVAAGVLALLVGCGDDVTAGPAASPVTATPTAGTTGPSTSTGGATGAAPPTDASSTSSPSDPDGAGSEPAGPEALAVPQDAGTGPSEEEAAGGALSVVDVRTGRHEGFDRVVLELAGEDGGEPGWFARYVDEPAQEGSGAPLEVDGSSYLTVAVRGLGYPFDTGQEEVTGTTAGQGTELVRQVHVGGVHEGQAQVVVGLEEEAPYRVTRLSDPPRVVVDVLT